MGVFRTSFSPILFTPTSHLWTLAVHLSNGFWKFPRFAGCLSLGASFWFFSLYLSGLPNPKFSPEAGDSRLFLVGFFFFQTTLWFFSLFFFFLGLPPFF